MANTDSNGTTVHVTLKRSVGLRRKGAVSAKHYGPGEVDIPLADAVSLGIANQKGELIDRFAEQEPEEAGEDVNISDTARELAESNEIDITTLTGTGKNGRIVAKDVQAAIDAKADTGNGGGNG